MPSCMMFPRQHTMHVPSFHFGSMKSKASRKFLLTFSKRAQRRTTFSTKLDIAVLRVSFRMEVLLCGGSTHIHLHNTQDGELNRVKIWTGGG